jgi:hypothetical protein
MAEQQQTTTAFIPYPVFYLPVKIQAGSSELDGFNFQLFGLEY